MILMSLLAVLALAFIFRLLKYKKTSRGLSLVAVLVFFWATSGFLPDTLLSFLQTHSRLEKTTWAKTNAVIVLCAGNVVWDAEGILVPRNVVMSRLHEGLRQYLRCKKTAQVCALILSGGRPKDASALSLSEAQVLKKSFIEVGVSAEDIITEDQSHDTEDNASMTADILKSRAFESLVLVTSGSHLKRANEWFLHSGLRADLAPADHLQVRFNNSLTAYNLELADVALHELLGLVEVRIKTFFR